MRIEPEIGQCTIVLVGHFSPPMFSPLWFARNGLISPDQAEAAKVGILHQDIAVLSVGKFRIQVEGSRFTIETAEAPWIDLCDFVAKTFTEFLLNTPINQLGINRLIHFSVGTEERRNRIGQLLAPLEPWGEWGRAIAASPPELRGGCVDVTMRLPRPPADCKGHLQISVQPSIRIKGNTGIYAQTNDHYDIGPLEDTVDCAAIINILVKNFESSNDMSERLFDQVMSLGEQL